jgi:hypothetical protein
MDPSVSRKDQIWFLRVCHHVSDSFYQVCYKSGPEHQVALKQSSVDGRHFSLKVMCINLRHFLVALKTA